MDQRDVVDGTLFLVLAAILFFLLFFCTKSDCGEIATEPNLTMKIRDVEVESGDRITAEVGELIRLDLRDSVMGGISWQTLPSTPDFEVIEDGRRALLSARGESEFLIMVAGAADNEAFLYHIVVVVGGAQSPTPALTLTKKVKDWMGLVKPYPKRSQHAAAVAGVFRKIAAQKLEVDKILSATALANSAVLANDLDKWEPFLDELGHALDGLEISTRGQYEALWNQIADGIESGV